MRLALTSACCAVAMVVSAAAQSPVPEKSHPPKNGDEVVVKGCLRGVMLESSDVGRVPGDDLTPMAFSFQLKGKKDLLKQLRAEHDNTVVEVTGVLKSTLDAGAQRGTTFGRTRIVVGAESSMRGGPLAPGSAEPMPVLEVKAFEGTSLSCGR